MGAHLPDAKSLVNKPTFPPGQQGSLLCKFLTQDVWDELKNAEDSAGFSFKEAIFSGCKNPDSGIGVYAGSHDSYSTFKSLLHPIIYDYHKFAPSSKHTSNMLVEDLVAPPFSPEDAAMIKSTRIRVARNLASFPLGPGISRQ